MESIPKKSGIYQIRNLVNGKVYIGSSVNMYDRWCEHRSELKHNSHHSQKLQRAYNKYGEHNLIFEVIEQVDTLELLDKEQYYINLHNSVENGYNICKETGKGPTLYGKSNPKSHPVICLETGKIFESIIEASKQTNTSSIGIGQCCIGKQNTANGLHWYYKGDKPPTIKTSVNGGYKRPVICIETQKTYNSIVEASRDTHINKKCISDCCLGKQYTAGKLHWKYAD